MNRIAWNDCETTDVDTKHGAIIQIAVAIEDNGNIIDTFNRNMAPHAGASITDKALEVNKHTREQIAKFDSPSVVYADFYRFLDKNGFCKQKNKRFIPGGYNNGFDLEFISAWFERESGGPFAFWDFLQFSPIDPLPLIRMLNYYGIIKLENCQLGSACKYFGVELDPHDAMSDVMATRELTGKLVKIFPTCIPRFESADKPSLELF